MTDLRDLIGNLNAAPLLARLRQKPEAPAGERKFGTFAGVFVPTILTILGAIMYLRLGWVVGNAGLVGAVVIIVLAHIITISTGLAVASIATNTRVGAGGAFSIISQSLGLEVGGSVGIPLYLAQGISITLYVLAFAEAWVSVFNSHPLWLVAIITFLIVFAIAYRSAQFAARMQYVILAIVAFSLVSIFLGSFEIGGRPGLPEAPVLWGEFGAASFWDTFAIFFPAVTGIMAGISLSGALKDPRRSIPVGSMGAIGLGMAIYLSLAVWLAMAATPAEMLGNSTIMTEKAFFGWAIIAGMLGATFSSALGSIVAAPRVMQALAMFKVLPAGDIFARQNDEGEPRPAMIATGIIALVTLIIALAGGGLNAVAEIITMFFLITYAMLNVVILIEQTLGMVSFRPTFSIPRLVPFVGMVGCLFVMFLVNPGFSLVALVLVLAMYGFLARRSLERQHNDVRSGLFIALAEWAAVRASRMPSAPERSWKPQLLVPVRTTGEMAGSYRFLWALTAPQGSVHILGIYCRDQMEPLAELGLFKEAFLDDHIVAHMTLLQDEDFVNGVRVSTQVLSSTLFRPNILFLQLRADSDLDRLQTLVDDTAAYKMGIVVLARHEIKELGREQLINVWISNQGPDWVLDLRRSNQDLALLLAYKLMNNWHGRINLCMAVGDAETAVQARDYLTRLVTLTRLPAGRVQKIVIQQPFTEALQRAPRADLSVFGLPDNADLQFSRRIFALVDSSCVFVRDSDLESALA